MTIYHSFLIGQSQAVRLDQIGYLTVEEADSKFLLVAWSKVTHVTTPTYWKIRTYDTIVEGLSAMAEVCRSVSLWEQSH